MNPLRVLVDAIQRRRLRRIAARRLDMMLSRDGVVTIYVRRLGDAGVALARRPAVATYRIGLADSYSTAPRGTRKAVRRTA